MKYMSYCRTSSDNFRSDVYMYSSGSDGMYHIHLAHTTMKDKDFDKIPWKEAMEREKIPLNPYKGRRDFCFRSNTKTRDFLLELRNAGYWVPQSAIDRIESEIKNEKM